MSCKVACIPTSMRLRLPAAVRSARGTMHHSTGSERACHRFTQVRLLCPVHQNGMTAVRIRPSASSPIKPSDDTSPKFIRHQHDAHTDSRHGHTFSQHASLRLVRKMAARRPRHTFAPAIDRSRRTHSRARLRRRCRAIRPIFLAMDHCNVDKVNKKRLGPNTVSCPV